MVLGRYLREEVKPTALKTPLALGLRGEGRGGEGVCVCV